VVGAIVSLESPGSAGADIESRKVAWSSPPRVHCAGAKRANSELRIRVFIDFITTRIRALDLDYSTIEQNGQRQSAAIPMPATEIGVKGLVCDGQCRAS